MVGSVQSKSSSERDTEATLLPRDRGSARPATEMLELSREECLRLLASHHFGRLAVNIGDGPPVIRPVNYLFDERSQSVVLRTARGSKFHALLHSATAAFEIDGIDESSRTGWSVIIRGVTDEVTNAGQVHRLERLGLEPWAPGPKRHWMHIGAWTVAGRRIVLGDESFPGYYLG
jgi:nitroimidazol reductase NimA-like FMN-containing flavoprotein (pyridoxamine 5'-phosphate oxidase superfamily)